MDNNENNTNVNQTVNQNTEASGDVLGFAFFKNCSKTLKRFSVLIFIINIFITVVAAAIGIVLLVVNMDAELLSVLIIPIITAIIIAIVFARFVSALIYGFAEIVEKAEKK